MISSDLSYNNEKANGNYPYLIYHQAISAISEGDKKGIVYAGTDDGRVWLTKDDGASWKEITKGLPFNKHVAKITASVHDPARVYLVLNDRRQDNHSPYAYRSDDFGSTWIPIAGNLPESPVNVIIEHPDRPNIIFCGNDMGVYISSHRGKIWLAMNGNIPAAVSVHDMFIHPRDKKLVIGTYGRGVYILDDISLFR